VLLLAHKPLVSNNIYVVHYNIQLDVLDFTNRVIYGATVITFTPAEASLSQVNLELRQLVIDSLAFDGDIIQSFTHDGDALQIILPAALSPGDTSQLSIWYHGVPFSESWGGFHFSGEYAFNLGVGFETYPPNLGKAWFPCVDDFSTAPSTIFISA
jgi:aminopeptidase N